MGVWTATIPGERDLIVPENGSKSTSWSWRLLRAWQRKGGTMPITGWKNTPSGTVSTEWTIFLIKRTDAWGYVNAAVPKITRWRLNFDKRQEDCIHIRFKVLWTVRSLLLMSGFTSLFPDFLLPGHRPTKPKWKKSHKITTLNNVSKLWAVLLVSHKD